MPKCTTDNHELAKYSTERLGKEILNRLRQKLLEDVDKEHHYCCVDYMLYEQRIEYLREQQDTSYRAMAERIMQEKGLSIFGLIDVSAFSDLSMGYFLFLNQLTGKLIKVNLFTNEVFE